MLTLGGLWWIVLIYFILTPPTVASDSNLTLSPSSQNNLTPRQNNCNTNQNPHCAGNPQFEALCCNYPNVCYWDNRYASASCCAYGQVCGTYNTPVVVGTLVPTVSIITQQSISPTPTPTSTSTSTAAVAVQTTTATTQQSPTAAVNVITTTTAPPPAGGGAGGGGGSGPAHVSATVSGLIIAASAPGRATISGVLLLSLATMLWHV